MGIRIQDVHLPPFFILKSICPFVDRSVPQRQVSYATSSSTAFLPHVPNHPLPRHSTYILVESHPAS
jgi:hypothetical protein